MSLLGPKLRAAASFKGFNPALYGTITSWWKADAIAGVSSGSALSAWLDSSGNGKPLGQATGALQPLYETNVQNGLPIVRFNLSSMGSGNYAGNVSSPFSVSAFVVLNVANNTNPGEILTTRNGSTGFLLRALASQTGYLWDWIAGSSATYSQASGSWHLVEVLQTGTSVQIGVDGTLASAVTFSGYTTSPSGGLAIGASNALSADIGEILFYSSTVSNRTAIENYLINKWALP